MSVAAVVVANPVVAPRADLQIPAVKLSGTGDALDMLNNDFLSRIAPPQTDSTSNPFAVLKDLIASLAADATYLTRNAIVSAFFAGANAVSDPKLTAASFPYVPSPANPLPVVPTGPHVWPTPGSVAGGMSSDQLLAAVAALPADVVPAAAEVVMTLMDDVRNISDGSVVTAAFAAGALLVTAGGRALESVAGLVDDGVQAALTTVLDVVRSGNPPAEIIEILRGAIEPVPGLRLFTPARVESPPSAPSVPASPSAPESPSAGSALLASPVPSTEAVGAERVQRRKLSVDTAVTVTPPAPELSDPEISVPEILTGAADQTDTPAAAPARTPARPAPLKDAITEARNQAQRILHDATDAVRKAADHAAKASAGPAGG